MKNVIFSLSGGELFDHLATMDCLTEGETVAFTVQVLEALRIMHSSQIVHLDLKARNALTRVRAISRGLLIYSLRTLC